MKLPSGREISNEDLRGITNLVTITALEMDSSVVDAIISLQIEADLMNNPYDVLMIERMTPFRTEDAIAIVAAITPVAVEFAIEMKKARGKHFDDIVLKAFPEEIKEVKIIKGLRLDDIVLEALPDIKET